MEAIGKIQKTFGAHGELIIALYGSNPLPVGKPVFIDINGLLTPFYVGKVEERGKKLLVVFDDMEAETLAAELVGKEIMAEQQRKKNTAAHEGSTLDELLDYRVADVTHGELGTIIGWLDYPNNPCLQVVNPQQQEILIPANGALIAAIAKKEKNLTVDLPQGLIEIYLEAK
jgi:16S rRNA processing protein RimM